MVMDLHDCNARNRSRQNLLKNNYDRTNVYEDAVVKRSNTLRTDTFFNKLTLHDQKSIYKGQRACIYSQCEILSRVGEDAPWIRAYYHFLPSLTHSMPLGFSRMAEQGRGYGGENVIGKAYTTFALDFNSNILNDALPICRESFQI